MTPDNKLRIMASRQHGLVLWSQARGVGLSRHSIARRIDEGLWLPVTPRVLRFVAAPQTDLQRAMAATLDAGTGGCISHDSAAALYGLPRFRLDPLHVWRIRATTKSPNRVAVQHLTRRLPPQHILLFHGIPVTSPTRMLLDQAAVLEPWAFERLAEDTWSEGLTNWYCIDRLLGVMSKQGRTGLTALRDFAVARGPDYRPAQSNLERRVQAILRAVGHDGFDRQVDVGDERRWIGRVDFRHRIYPLVLEVQSTRFHGALLDEAADAARVVALRAAGFVVVELWEHDAWYDPTRIVAQTEAGLAVARALRPTRAA
jgi:very-short-patch-repair endonuclease